VTTTSTTVVFPTMPVTTLGRLRWTLIDGWTLVRREFWHMRADPVQIVLPLVFSGALVLLFGYVFGSAISVPGSGNYREYLLPGLFVLASGTPATLNATAIAREKGRGVIDRFRSMPMARLAMPLGRTGADIGIGIIALAMMSVVGIVVGWRVHEGIWHTAAGFAILLLFRYAMSWVGVYIGLAVKAETIDNLAPLFFPIVMISNAFVPTSKMPAWLRYVAEWNPVSAVTQACRVLFGNPGANVHQTAFPLQHPVAASILWSLALIAIFAPLAVHQYVTSEK
jgi:ABC-2 type transport system permease protein